MKVIEYRQTGLLEGDVAGVHGQVVVEEGQGSGEVGLGKDARVDEAASHETADGLVQREGLAISDLLFGPHDEVEGAGH